MNKSFKKMISLLLVALTALTMLCACGKKDKAVSVDPAKLASELNSSTVTSDTLTETQASMLPTIYYIDEAAIASGAAYMSSGATACEVVVIECKEAGQTKDVKEKFEQRVSAQSDLYASYNAGEVDKLKAAIIKTAGNYAVLCVCDDTKKAEEILKGYGF